jgi:hypothetical protein
VIGLFYNLEVLRILHIARYRMSTMKTRRYITVIDIFLILFGVASISAQTPGIVQNGFDYEGLKQDLSALSSSNNTIESWSFLLSAGSRTIDEQTPFLVIGFLPGTKVNNINIVMEKTRSIITSRASFQIVALSRYRWKAVLPLKTDPSSSILEATRSEIDAIEMKYKDIMLVIKGEVVISPPTFTFFMCSKSDPDVTFQKDLDLQLSEIINRYYRK